jgi:DNA-binding NtrC family response regulator
VGTDRPIRVDVRIVAASNVPLTRLVEAGTFLPDLEVRLGLFRVFLPPLRERREDIRALTVFSIRRRAAELGYDSPPAVDAALMRSLECAEWPMNIRQLDATITRLLVEADGATRLTLEHCSRDLDYLRKLGRPTRNVSPVDVKEATARWRTRSEAAQALGVSQATLYRRLRVSASSSDGDRPTESPPEC